MAIVGVCVLVGFIAYVVVTRSPNQPSRPSTFPVAHPTSLHRGATAPSFTLPRLGGGPAVNLGAAGGRPTMVNFFASWCRNCRQELSAVAATATATAGRIAVIGVDTSDTSASAAEQLLAAAGATYPVGVDPSATLAARYRITGLPVTYFLSAKGIVEGVAFGPQTERALLRWAARLSPAPGAGAASPAAASHGATS